tara:strand:+ start:223 stop:495 length:273 start_codon:yes stop_codon:yes gene_type:complete
MKNSRDLEKTLNTFFGVTKKVDKNLINQNARDRYSAKKLAKELKIDLTTGRDSCGWNCWIETENENIDGMFCTSWNEVLYKLEQIKKGAC